MKNRNEKKHAPKKCTPDEDEIKSACTVLHFRINRALPDQMRKNGRCLLPEYAGHLKTSC